MDNPLNTKGTLKSLVATYHGPKPGDFPLGSPESRAAARAMLLESRKLSPYDRDCLLISYSEQWLYGTCPDWREVESTQFFKRGFELEQLLDGPIIPAHLNTKFQRQIMASMAFEQAYKREPVVGDVLRYEDIERVKEERQYPLRFAIYTEVWKRRLPHLVFPWKCEAGKLYKRCKPDGKTITWELDQSHEPSVEWRGIVKEALGLSNFDPGPPDLPAVSAVVFVESTNEKFATKPVG